MDAKYRLLDLKQDKINTPARKEKWTEDRNRNFTKALLQMAVNYEVTQDLISNQRGVD